MEEVSLNIPARHAKSEWTEAESEVARTTRTVAGDLLHRQECALLVIDLQEKLLPAIFERERVVKHARHLLSMARTMGLPVHMTTQYAKGLGPIIPEIAAEVPDARPLDKTEFGCFGNREFCSRMGERGMTGRTLLVAGIESHICVTQTVLGALATGFRVHVAADAVSSRTPFNWQIGLERMKAAGAVMSSTEMIIYELLAQSGTEEFQRMLQLIK